VDSVPGDVTQLLRKLSGGDHQAAEELVPLVYNELRRLAVRHLRRERRNHTLQATALVHEVYMKVVDQDGAQWQNRAQFFAVASQLMRRILVDYARTQQRAKRGGGQQRVTLDEFSAVTQVPSAELLAVDEALARLEKLDPRQARVVELRYFGGLTVEEAAEALGISSKTVNREWNVAKAWLYGALRNGNATTAVQEKV
jgi:RNA polymerase sigma-70 factor (ECF subfamily)